MQLFEMKKLRAESLDKAEAVLAIAEAAKRPMTAEETKVFDAHMAECTRLTKQIEPREAQNTIFNTFPGGRVIPATEGGARKPNANALRATTIVEAMQYASAEEVAEIKAFARYIGGDMSAVADLTPSGDGGVIIPQTIANVVERNYSEFAPVASVARLWPTVTGEKTIFPVVSDEEEAEILAPAAETGLDDAVTGDTPVTKLTGPEMGAHKFSSKPIYVPRETITDSTINVLDEMLAALLARIIRTQNKKYTYGTGIGEPEGFLKNAAAYVAGAVALDLDLALDVAYNVPALYRPSGVYMLSDTTAKYLRKLATGLAGDKRKLWADADATKGQPPTLHGYPVVINNDMDSVAADGTFAGKVPLAFGNYKKFVVRKAENGVPYIYRWPVPMKDGSAVIAFSRSDSKLIVPEAISKLVVA